MSTLNTPRNTISRIDKLVIDRDGVDADAASRERHERGLDIVVGADAAESRGLQLALLTAVNIGRKCFGGKVTVHAPETVWQAPCLPRIVPAPTVGTALEALGAIRPTGTAQPIRRHLLLGDGVPGQRSLRVTFDGWIAVAGPEDQTARRAERLYFPPACIVAAAIGVGQVFAEFARVNVVSGHLTCGLSLWRPDLSVDDPVALGSTIVEAPRSIAMFGLGHLGQAYLWSWAGLDFADTQPPHVLLCDDDVVIRENFETGALLRGDEQNLLKTRVTSRWLERRGFTTRLLERRVDEHFRRTRDEPRLALAGFDDNQARQWLADAGFARVIDCGLGGEATNFDSIALQTWPNAIPKGQLWPIAMVANSGRETRARALRDTAAYQALAADECGRLLLAGQSVAVPFVGAVASGLAVAELVKTATGDPTFDEVRLNACALGTVPARTRFANASAHLPRGIEMHALRAA